MLVTLDPSDIEALHHNRWILAHWMCVCFRYSAAINQFIKFPSAFRLTPSFIKITQALWLLDHQDYTVRCWLLNWV